MGKDKLEKQIECEYTFLPKFNSFTISLIGVFSALCFGVLYLKIPLPSPVGKPMIHLGNMIVMLVAVLFNGFTGGIAGSIGMGLYDLLNGYGVVAIKTMILKFGIGFIVGSIFYLLNKNKVKKINTWLWGFGSLFLLIGVTFLSLSLIYNGKIEIDLINKEILIPWSTYTFAFIIGLFSLICAFFTNKMDLNIQYVLFACMGGVLFNLIGEFITMIIYQLLNGAIMEVATLSAVASLPATVINGTISTLIVVLVYKPLKMVIPNNPKRY